MPLMSGADAIRAGSREHRLDVRDRGQPAKWPEITIGAGHFFPGARVRATGIAKPATGCLLQAAYGF
jgi:hypothetical protein